MALEDIIVKTGMGDIELPSQKLYEFIKYITNENKKESDLRYQQIEEFFAPLSPNAEYFSLAPHKVPSYLKSFWSVLERDFNIIAVKDYGGKGQFEIPPTSHDFETSLGVKENLIMNATIFAEKKDKSCKLVFCLSPYADKGGYFIEMEAFSSSKEYNFKKFWQDVENYFVKEGPLKNSIINTSWNFIKYDNRDWNSIVMDESNEKLIHRNIVNFVENMQEYEKLKLPTSRGILITGPPGTGKTLCCETIMNQLDCTSIYVTSDSVEKPGDIKEVYALARKLSPTVVVIEDIDTLGGLDRRDRGNHPLLGEFLNCLNGVGNNNGVITIATTNYPNNLDLALSDRPGRIDLKVEFGLPDKDLREHIMKKYLKDLPSKNIDYEKMAKKTEGLSGAYLREIVMLAYMIANEKDSKINNDILIESYANVMEMKEQVNKYNGIIKPTNNYYN